MERFGDITQVLQQVDGGDRAAFDQLLSLVYEELRVVAARAMQNERADHTLQPTALVNELYVKLLGQSHLRWESRAHFFGAAARAMRQILVDHARTVRRKKRGGEWRREPLDTGVGIAGRPTLDLIALDEALAEFAECDSHRARTVELRYFGGLSSEEAAKVLGVTARTVDRDCRYAEAWLSRHMTRRGAPRG